VLLVKLSQLISVKAADLIGRKLGRAGRVDGGGGVASEAKRF
jgi:hypothetical protein